MKRIQIDRLEPGTAVLLEMFNRSEALPPEHALFLGVVGEGESRRAHFSQMLKPGASFDWEAYRFGGRWAYGSSADRMRVVGVLG